MRFVLLRKHLLTVAMMTCQHTTQNLDECVCAILGQNLCASPVQVGKLLAELVREPLGPGAGGGSSSRREVNAGSEPGTAGNMGE